MKELIFSKVSDLDLKDAIDYYNSKQSGLGDKLFHNLQNKVEKIIANPLGYSIRYKNVRCARIERFPFMVHYVDESSLIVVIGIIHTSRNPRLWKQRKK